MGGDNQGLYDETASNPLSGSPCLSALSRLPICVHTVASNRNSFENSGCYEAPVVVTLPHH